MVEYAGEGRFPGALWRDERGDNMADETITTPTSELISGENDLTVTFLAQGAQTGAQIATMLADFIAGAERTLDIAAYDFRLEQ